MGSFDMLYVVHVGLPVLNVPPMISGNHPILIVTPSHRSNSRIVSLYIRSVQ